MSVVEVNPGTAGGANKSYQVFRSESGMISYRVIGSDVVIPLPLPEIRKMLERLEELGELVAQWRRTADDSYSYSARVCNAYEDCANELKAALQRNRW